VSPQKPFGLRTFFRGDPKSFKGSVTLYSNNAVEYIKESVITQNADWIKNCIFYKTKFNLCKPHINTASLLVELKK